MSSKSERQAKFERQTAATLVECAKWLEEKTETLAKTFSNGGRGWEITFSAGDDGLFPYANVHVEADGVVVACEDMEYGGDGNE